VDQASRDFAESPWYYSARYSSGKSACDPSMKSPMRFRVLYRRTALPAWPPNQLSKAPVPSRAIGSSGALLNHLGSKNLSVKGLPSMSDPTLSFDCPPGKSDTLKAKLQAGESTSLRPGVSRRPPAERAYPQHRRWGIISVLYGWLLGLRSISDVPNYRLSIVVSHLSRKTSEMPRISCARPWTWQRVRLYLRKGA